MIICACPLVLLLRRLSKMTGLKKKRMQIAYPSDNKISVFKSEKHYLKQFYTKKVFFGKILVLWIVSHNFFKNNLLLASEIGKSGDAAAAKELKYFALGIGGYLGEKPYGEHENLKVYRRNEAENVKDVGNLDMVAKISRLNFGNGTLFLPMKLGDFKSKSAPEDCQQWWGPFEQLSNPGKIAIDPLTIDMAVRETTYTRFTWLGFLRGMKPLRTGPIRKVSVTELQRILDLEWTTLGGGQSLVDVRTH